MKTYIVSGYCKQTGQKITIRVLASTERHAKTVAYNTLRCPKVIGTGTQKHRPGER